jgi:hypothetical protein
MSGNPIDPTEPAPSGRSRYEDYDLTVPTPQAGPKRRTPTLTVAAVVMVVSGVLPLITVVAFHPEAGATAALLVLSAAELLGATLVLTLHPLGRPVGIALGCVGVGLGIVSATQSPANGLVGIALNGFIIYAMASSGPSFRRE